MRTYLIMDGRASTGERAGYEEATCLESCDSLDKAKKSVRDWPMDACVWESDTSKEYPASVRMVYSWGRWYI